MLHDLRLAVRLLRRTPGFTTAAVLTLAIGIGMTTAIFSVVHAVLLRPVPLPDADRLVMLWETDRDSGTTHEPGSWPDFVDFQQRSRRIERMAGFIAGEATLSVDRGEPIRAATLSVTHGLLPLMGVRPLVGRTFTAAEDRPGGAAVILISERLWARVFQRDPAAIGRTLRVDDRPQTNVGVVPSNADFGVLQILSAADYGRGFADRDARSQVDVWSPLQADPAQLVRDTHPLLMIARLAREASVASAQEELTRIAADLERAYPSNNARGVFLEPMEQVIFGRSEPALLVLVSAVGLVLLIACVNVANLLLVRGTGRRREVAVRAALGAGTTRLARQFVAENLLLTTLSATLGIGAAVAALRIFLRLAPADVPRLASAGIDGSVLAVALGITLVVALIFGALPVLQSRKADLRSALNAEDARGATAGREGSFARATLVITQVALAVVLVTGSTLLIRSFWRLQQVDPGFNPQGVLKVEFELPGTRYPFTFEAWPDLPSIHNFNAALLSRVGAIPGVEAAGLAGAHPLSAGFTNSFAIVGREAESRDFPEISTRAVSPGYFRTLGLKLARGRFISDQDGTKSMPVVLINEAAADRFFAGRDALGQQLAFWGRRWTIVGIVGNEKFHGLSAAAPTAAYAPIAQAPRDGQTLLVRVSGDPLAAASAVRAAIAEIDPALATFGIEPLERTLSQSLGNERFLTVLLLVFAAVALTLAAVGIHGVLSYAVVHRTRELGIRMALGASPGKVLRLVLGQSAALTIGGLAIGLTLGALFARALAGLLFGVTPGDVTTFVVVPVVLGLVAAVATWLPARRAVLVDPVIALRDAR